MLAAEMVLQVAAAITQNADKLNVVEWPVNQVRWPHDVIVVALGGTRRTPIDNESDAVDYDFAINLATMGEDRAEMGYTLDTWARATSQVLGDRASDQSPLRAATLPLSTLALSGSAVLTISIGATETTTFPDGSGGFRAGVVVPVTVRCYERAA